MNPGFFVSGTCRKSSCPPQNRPRPGVSLDEERSRAGQGTSSLHKAGAPPQAAGVCAHGCMRGWQCGCGHEKIHATRATRDAATTRRPSSVECTFRPSLGACCVRHLPSCARCGCRRVAVDARSDVRDRRRGALLPSPSHHDDKRGRDRAGARHCERRKRPRASRADVAAAPRRARLPLRRPSRAMV